MKAPLNLVLCLVSLLAISPTQAWASTGQPVSAVFAAHWEGEQTEFCRIFNQEADQVAEQLSSLMGATELRNDNRFEISREGGIGFCNDWDFSRKIPTKIFFTKIYTVTASRELLESLVAKVGQASFHGKQMNLNFISGFIQRVDSSIVARANTSRGSYVSPVLRQANYASDSFKRMSDRCTSLASDLVAAETATSCKSAAVRDLREFVIRSDEAAWQKLKALIPDPSERRWTDEFSLLEYNQFTLENGQAMGLTVENEWVYPNWWLPAESL